MPLINFAKRNLCGVGLSCAAGLLAVSLVGCSPTYRHEQMVQAIREICTTDYHFPVDVRQVGQTIAVHLRHEGVLEQSGNQIGLSNSVNEVLGNVVEAIHRVILSSDTLPNFYIVLVSDPKVPGVYLTLIRYVEDVRRANANMLTPSEFFSRTVFDLKFVGIPGAGLEQLAPNDIQLEQFLSWQLARRIQTHLTEQLQRHGLPTADIGPCSGEFHNGEFAFTLNVEPKKSGSPARDELVQQIFQDATSVIAKVLSDYRFNNFQAIRLVHLPTGRSLLLPKTRLELFQ